MSNLLIRSSKIILMAIFFSWLGTEKNIVLLLFNDYTCFQYAREMLNLEGWVTVWVADRKMQWSVIMTLIASYGKQWQLRRLWLWMEKESHVAVNRLHSMSHWWGNESTKRFQWPLQWNNWQYISDVSIMVCKMPKCKLFLMARVIQRAIISHIWPAVVSMSLSAAGESSVLGFA